MLEIVRFGFIAGMTAIITGGLAWLISRARPAAASADSGTIAPEKWSALFTVVFGAIMFLGGGVAILAGEWPMGLVVSIMGAAAGGFMTPSLTNTLTGDPLLEDAAPEIDVPLAGRHRPRRLE